MVLSLEFYYWLPTSCSIAYLHPHLPMHKIRYKIIIKFNSEITNLSFIRVKSYNAHNPKAQQT